MNSVTGTLQQGEQLANGIGEACSMSETTTGRDHLADFNADEKVTFWHVEPLLGNDGEISSYTTAVVREQLCKHARC
jgi:hypothetical protein